MNCENCGFANSSKETVCINCGAPLNKVEEGNIFGSDILKPINVEPVVESSTLETAVDEVAGPVMEESVNPSNIIDEEKEEVNVVPTEEISQSYNEMKEPVIEYTKSNEPFDLKRTLVAVGGIVLASIIILLAVVVLTNNNKTKYQGVDTTTVSEDYKISFNGYDIIIPANYAYQVDSNNLIIKEKDEKWITIIQVSDFNYSKLVVNKKAIKESYEKLGMTATEFSEKTYQNVSVLTSELKKQNVSMALGITKASTEQSFVIVSITSDDKASYDGLNSIAPMLSRAEYKGVKKSKTIKSDFFDFSQIKG